jgi:hypothetical protein
MRPLLTPLLAVAIILLTSLVPSDFPPAFAQPEASGEPPLSAKAIEKRLEGSFDAEDIAATSSWVQTTGIVDWLGPLAPVALSPFFGVTCLSGMAIWGPDWVTNNAVLGSSGPLKNETLFALFLGLTLLTSLPRLTKVSKPFAQAVDRIETYAVIVILLVIKLFASTQATEGVQVAVVQLGIFSFTVDTLLAIAMVINVLVINSVKFFFEFLVWLTPIPFLDAIFEVCNKSLCAALMAVYAFSPTVATVINLAMLLAAALVLRWISRRVRFYRTMILDPILAKLWTGFGQPKRPELIVFPRSAIGPFAPKSRLRLRRSDTESSDGSWVLEEANWWMPAKRHAIATPQRPKVCPGWVMHSITIQDQDGSTATFHFSRRYDQQSLTALLSQLNIEATQWEAPVVRDARSEFA